ncbi:protein tweety-like isoform X3 [Tachypleus tridentatus]|uniref:protein tweety-like isoform X3 n=1 Tax=Tachypleus tridentatus TaxID=6853 RepID=UPI003FD1A8E5
MNFSSHYGFKVSPVTRWFHIFPHVDINFQQVNSTFDITDNSYLEALGILVAIPGFWLILTLLAFLIFFLCCCCCCGSNKKQKKLAPLKWTLGIFSVLCCGTLAVGFYGNFLAHEGIQKVEGATQEMQVFVQGFHDRVNHTEFLLTQNVRKNLQQLNVTFKQAGSNATVQSELLELIQAMSKNISQLTKKVKDIDVALVNDLLKSVNETIHLVELFRWPATFAVLGLLVIFCFILIGAICRTSRCLLIFFSVVGLMSVVVCWVLVSFYLGLCVAAGDFCLQPEPYLHKEVDPFFNAGVVQYYIHCGQKVKNPFSKSFKESMAKLDNLERSLGEVKELAEPHFSQPKVFQLLDQLAESLSESRTDVSVLQDCTSVYRQYNKAMEATCTTGIEGTAFLLVSAVGSGFFFTILIWLASCTWIHVRKKQTAEPPEEEETFLPQTSNSSTSRRTRDMYGHTGFRPRNSHTPPQTPLVAALSVSSSSSNREEQPFLAGRYTPPPSCPSDNDLYY